MPKQNQNETQPKAKLRTASEVIARLKWSYDEAVTAQNALIGYDCRINGPMEKCVEDYIGINEGGDIPEHRIQYFRTNTMPLNDSILWDRHARVDRLFGSGAGADAPLSPITLANTAKAIKTMKRLAEEKALRAQEKAKRRARQQAKKAAVARKLNTVSLPGANENEPQQSNRRHEWMPVNFCASYDNKKSTWINKKFPFCSNEVDRTIDKLNVVTWNVLFDLTRNQDGQLVQGDDSLLGGSDGTEKRWGDLLNILSHEDADIIALQEVTPRFLSQLQSQPWVEGKYSLSGNTKSLDPLGNLLLWKQNSFRPMGLYECRDGGRNRATIVALKLGNQRILNVANVHLPARSETNDRTQARKRELGAVIAKLQILERLQKKIQSTALILGDFNSGDQDPKLFQDDVFVDAWRHCEATKDLDGFTFDWKRNIRAEKTRSHGHCGKPPRRIDRVLVGNLDLNPFQCTLLGCPAHGDGGSFSPSDHFGIRVSFQVSASPAQSPLYDAEQVTQNAWATSAIPTKDSLLALVLEDSTVAGTDLYDDTSTLPMPHLTLLNGFVELTSDETEKLAIQAVEDAVRQTMYSEDPKQEWPLILNHQSLCLFEHTNSATLVCRPSLESEEGAWLLRLYQTLRAKFSLCHEQESRFADGWSPHCKYVYEFKTFSKNSAFSFC